MDVEGPRGERVTRETAPVAKLEPRAVLFLASLHLAFVNTLTIRGMQQAAHARGWLLRGVVQLTAASWWGIAMQCAVDLEPRPAVAESGVRYGGP